MKRGLLVYTSNSGTTKAVANEIAEGLTRNGCHAETMDLRERSPIDVRGYDFLGVGSPACMFRPSYLALDFISGLSPLARLPFFTFVTYGTDIGEAANRLRRGLTQKGGQEVGHFRCHGKNRFPGYTSRGFLFSPDCPTKDELRGAEHFGRQLGTRLLEGLSMPIGEFDPPSHPIVRLERLLTGRPMIRHIYSRFFKTTSRCTNCGTCVRSCPKGNISPQENRPPTWGRDCILCLTCEINCRNRAVKTPISWFVFNPFLRFNIRRDQRRGVPFSKITD
jgi:flavodoxin/NAD-dependent dihydropyrimidine dehydrogenase PreA subunit